MNTTAIPTHRVVVTGVGVVSTAGIGVPAFWDGVCGRRVLDGSGPTREIVGWDASPFYDSPKDLRRADRFEQFAMASTLEALEMAGPLTSPAERTGVVFGSGLGGLRTYEEQQAAFAARGERAMSPLTVPMVMPNAAASAVSRRFGFTGPCETVSLACASGTHALGSAYRLIAWGVCDAVIAGGAESAGAPAATAAFSRMTALSSFGVSRPFDIARDGFVLSEGAAVLVLERRDVALARGARILAEVGGFAANADAYHISAPSPGGRGAADCIRLALSAAGVDPSAVGQVNAHGTSTALNDAAESEAVGSVFGQGRVPVTSIKGATGHALGAAGAIEAVSVVLSLTEGAIPPTLQTTDVDPGLGVDVVLGGPRPWTPAPVVSNSFAFGGHNASVVLLPV